MIDSHIASGAHSYLQTGSREGLCRQKCKRPLHSNTCRPLGAATNVSNGSVRDGRSVAAGHLSAPMTAHKMLNVADCGRDANGELVKALWTATPTSKASASRC